MYTEVCGCNKLRTRLAKQRLKYFVVATIYVCTREHDDSEQFEGTLQNQLHWPEAAYFGVIKTVLDCGGIFIGEEL